MEKRSALGVSNSSFIKQASLASVAGMMAVTFTHPLELTKTRLQLDQELSRNAASRQYRGWVHCVKSTFQNEGFRGLQRGLSAAFIREAIFNGFRIGAYEPILGAMESAFNIDCHDDHSSSGVSKLAGGLVVGALAAAICNPIDIIKVRMQSQGGMTGYQHNYGAGPFNALRLQLIQEGGITGLYKGVSVNITRGFLGPGTQLPAYNYLKHLLMNSKFATEQVPPVLQHAICAAGSAVVSVAFVNPVDVIRTRMYNQPFENISGKGKMYSNGLDALVKITRAEGPLAFYKGGLTHFGRLGPHMILVFVFLEQLKSIL